MPAHGYLLYTLHCKVGMLFHFMDEETEKLSNLEYSRFHGGRLRTLAPRCPLLHQATQGPGKQPWRASLRRLHWWGSGSRKVYILCSSQLPSGEQRKQCQVRELCLFILKPI